MNMREYWANEAALMRDKSAVLGNQGLSQNNVSGAWEISNKWSSTEIEKYRSAINGYINTIESNGETYSCEDFAIGLVMTFAKANKLPFKWVTGSQSFNASDSSHSGAQAFMKAVMKATGAADFQNTSNTILVNIDNAQVGDILALIDPEDKGVSHHIQVVSKRHGLPNLPNVALDIKQGNLSGRIFKITQKIQSGTHLLKRNEYFNKDDGKLYVPFSAFYKIETLTYNFSIWNE